MSRSKCDGANETNSKRLNRHDIVTHPAQSASSLAQKAPSPDVSEGFIISHATRSEQKEDQRSRESSGQTGRPSSNGMLRSPVKDSMPVEHQALEAASFQASGASTPVRRRKKKKKKNFWTERGQYSSSSTPSGNQTHIKDDFVYHHKDEGPMEQYISREILGQGPSALIASCPGNYSCTAVNSPGLERQIVEGKPQSCASPIDYQYSPDQDKTSCCDDKALLVTKANSIPSTKNCLLRLPYLELVKGMLKRSNTMNL